MQAADANTAKIISTVSQIANDLMSGLGKVIWEENLRRVSVGILSNGNML